MIVRLAAWTCAFTHSNSSNIAGQITLFDQTTNQRISMTFSASDWNKKSHHVTQTPQRLITLTGFADWLRWGELGGTNLM